MLITHDYNATICSLLHTHDVKFYMHGHVLMVDRTSMVQVFPGDSEQGSYDHTLMLIRDALPNTLYIDWSVRTDSWLSLEVLLRAPL